MSLREGKRRRRRRRLVGAAAIGVLALVLGVGLPLLGSAPRAAGATSEEEPTAQTDASVPAFNVTMIGSSPAEAPDETWGIGQADEGGSSGWVLVRYTDSGWTLGTGLQDASGQPLTGFTPDKTSESAKANPLAGAITSAGSGVLAGTVPGGAKGQQVLLTREPGGIFKETAPLPAEGEAALAEGEGLFGASAPPLIAALDESGGHAGAFVVPVDTNGVEDSVLHWSGSAWTREQIDVPAASSESFKVIGIGASSTSNAWLLARLSSHYPTGSVALFRRSAGEGGEPPVWKPVALTAGAGDEEAHPLSVDGKPFTVAESSPAEPLTVSEQGVWIDGERTDIHTATATLATTFFRPEGADGGSLLAAWCKLPEGAPSGTEPCDHELPQNLPTGFSRSFAWANSSTPFGERVITGLPEGVTLRLDGESFTRVLALGGSEAPNDVGGSLGAAFSSPREGWLGQERLPVHVTLHPVASRLSPWPVPFHHALVAIAPQPGAAVGALSSEALAVGDAGEVARYRPGEGWEQESLLGAGGRLQTPRLRSVAWPTTSRAYAVGDEGQMWLWRSETGLWEPDPATPYNFDANLTGIAFDPSEPTRGYAVGQNGVLLGYGKTWTQEQLPAQVAGASFTSIAFAGNEAIAAYHELPNPSVNSYVGGLLINEGSGWHVDEQAAGAMGSNIPWAVVGLPDGGAAFAAGEQNGSGDGGAVYERTGGGTPWQQTATPLPGGTEPGSLALFRENNELRLVASGSVPNTYSLESEPSPPPGSPPSLFQPYPLSAEYGAGHVIRQTATGWSDEEHELNDIDEPPGNYKFYDTVYQPDPVSAVLIGPTGTQGWAVGGFVVNEGSGASDLLDTADVDRYPADGSTPPGIGTSTIPTDPTQATFAIGGGAQCAAPCADRARAGIGPDKWLSHALARAGTISGVRAFLYTGPRVSNGETSGEPPPFPYAKELDRYAEVLGGSALPVFTALAPSDLDGRPLGAGSEATFEQAFGAFAQPLGNGPSANGFVAVGRSPEQCAATPGCQVAYYSLESAGASGTVRVIVLDDGTEVDSTQLAWLADELAAAKAVAQPAIVVGQGDLNSLIQARNRRAEEVAQTLIAGGASAYFYDSPEEDVSVPLSVGSASIPAFGSGTLGYVSAVQQRRGDFHGASGFLLGQVDIAGRNPSTNRAPVSARLIPSIGELAMEAEGGTLLQRSQVAMFAALARRPRSGNRAQNQANTPETDPYIPIPANCVGTACASGLFPEYSFSSSRPDIGDFVQPNLASAEPHAVLLGPGEKPIHDSSSGLFCAYNAGTTVVTVSAGGLSSSLTVTVQAGSVRRPCGTVPLKELPAAQQAAIAPPPAPAPAPTPSGTPLQATPPVVPVPPAPLVSPPAPVHSPTPHTARPFFVPAVATSPLLPFVPLPVPSPARPSPPTGTSAVTSPVEAAEKEEEHEEAPESVSNQAVAYRPVEHEVPPFYLLGIVILAAFAGASVRRRPRRGRRDVQVAPATISTVHSQRRLGRQRRNL